MLFIMSAPRRSARRSAFGWPWVDGLVVTRERRAEAVEYAETPLAALRSERADWKPEVWGLDVGFQPAAASSPSCISPW